MIAPKAFLPMIRDFFVPTTENDMTPLMLSRQSFVFYLVLAVGLLVGPHYLRLRELALVANPVSISPNRLIDLVNQDRAASGLPHLVPQDSLSRAAERKINDMLDRQYFAHFAPTDRKGPWDFIREEKYAYAAAGENLAENFVTADDAERAFMMSPTHRANILSPLFTEIGIAIGQGTFEGRPTIFIAQYFGKPRGVTGAVREAQASLAPKPAPKKPAPARPATTSPAQAHLRAETTTPTSAAAGVTESLNAPASTQIPIDWGALFRAPEVRVKGTVAIALAALLLGVALSLARGGVFTAEIIMRTAAMAVVLGYLLFSGDLSTAITNLTPTAATVFSALESLPQ